MLDNPAVNERSFEDRRESHKNDGIASRSLISQGAFSNAQ